MSEAQVPPERQQESVTWPPLEFETFSLEAGSARLGAVTLLEVRAKDCPTPDEIALLGDELHQHTEVPFRFAGGAMPLRSRLVEAFLPTTVQTYLVSKWSLDPRQVAEICTGLDVPISDPLSSLPILERKLLDVMGAVLAKTAGEQVGLITDDFGLGPMSRDLFRERLDELAGGNAVYLFLISLEGDPGRPAGHGCALLKRQIDHT